MFGCFLSFQSSLLARRVFLQVSVGTRRHVDARAFDAPIGLKRCAEVLGRSTVLIQALEGHMMLWLLGLIFLRLLMLFRMTSVGGEGTQSRFAIAAFRRILLLFFLLFALLLLVDTWPGACLLSTPRAYDHDWLVKLVLLMGFNRVERLLQV